VFDVFSVKRMYNITVNTGKNDLIFTKNDDADDDDNHKLGYSFLHLMSGLTKSSVSFITTCRQTDSSHNASIRPDWQAEYYVLNMSDSLSVHHMFVCFEM